MSKKTFLHKRLEDGLPLVVSQPDDTIYESNQGQESENFIELDRGIRVPLTHFSEISKKENDEVEYENVHQRKAEIQAQYQELENKKKAREAEDDNLLLFNFIRYAFLNYINISDEEIMPDAESSLVFSVDANKFKLNAGESASVLKRTLASQNSFLFINGKCYVLTEKQGSSPKKERIFLNGKNYWPEFTCTAEEFDQRYADCIQTAFETKIQEFYQAELAKLNLQKRKSSEMEKMLSAQRKENIDGQLGFAKVDGLYYLYTYHRGPRSSRYYYKIPVSKLKKEFGWFPPLALGLNITAKNGKVQFNVEKVADRENIRILHPVPYTHPAVIRFDRPDLCLRIGGYSYPKAGVGFTWNKRADLLEAIRDVFDQTVAIETGWATDEGNSIVYHGGIDSETFKEYKDLKKPIGWADDLLKWEGLKCDSKT